MTDDLVPQSPLQQDELTARNATPSQESIPSHAGPKNERSRTTYGILALIILGLILISTRTSGNASANQLSNWLGSIRPNPATNTINLDQRVLKFFPGEWPSA